MVRLSAFAFTMLIAAVSLPAWAGGNIGFAFMPIPNNDFVWTGNAGDGLWNSTGNWSGGKIPGSADTATFNNTCQSACNATINVNSVGSLYIDSTYTGTITQEAGRSVTFALLVTMNGGNFVGGNSALTFSNPFYQNGGTFTASTGTTTFNGWTTRTLGGTFNGTAGPLMFAMPANIGNTFKASSTTTTFKQTANFDTGLVFDANTGTVVFLREVAAISYPANNVGAALVFNVLKIQSTIAGGNHFVFALPFNTKDLILDSTVAGSTLTNGVINVSGDVSITGYGFTGNSVIKLTKAGTSSVDASTAASANLPSLELSGATTAATFAGTPLLAGNFSCLTGNTNAINGALFITGNVTASCALSGNSAITIVGSANSTIGIAGGSWPSGTLTINKTAVGNQVTQGHNLDLAAASQAMTVQSGTYLMSGKNLNVTGTLTINSGAVLTKGVGTLTRGTLVNNGTLN